MLRTMISATIVVVLATAASAESKNGRGNHPCDAAERSELGRLGVSLETVDRSSFVDVTDGGRSGIRVVGYEAWTSLTTCRGSVVTKFDLACRVQETYARGDCHLTGIRTY